MDNNVSEATYRVFQKWADYNRIMANLNVRDAVAITGEDMSTMGVTTEMIDACAERYRAHNV